VIFVISGSSFRWGRSSIPDPTMHTSLAAIPIFVLVIADGGCHCARARKGNRAGSCQITGAVEVRESRYRKLMKTMANLFVPELRAIDGLSHRESLLECYRNWEDS
jgi:hypothetical protein